jgi:ankyrin repeat protein
MLIHDYAADGDIEGVAHELASGVDIETGDERDHYTPLMHAVASAKAGLDMLQFLLERGANPNAVACMPNRTPRSVLCRAVKAGTFAKSAFLLDAGAVISHDEINVDLTPDFCQSLHDHGIDLDHMFPKHYNILLDAMYRRNLAKDPELLSIIQLLIERGAKLNTGDDNDQSALDVASRDGRFDAVQLLLNAGADLSPLEWTPLMQAIALGALNDVQRQLEQGADLAARDCWNRTPWLLSLQVGDVAKAKLLLAAAANLEDRGHCGKLPLVYPILNGHVAMLRWLLSLGINPNDANESQKTPLMEAAELGEADCAKVLIEAGSDINAGDEFERKAITKASSVEVLHLLLGSGADLNDINGHLRAKLTKLPNDRRIRVSREEFLATKLRRFGTSNPEKMNYPFWKSMITAGVNAWFPKKHFDDLKEFKREEIFCFDRFGKSINELPDGRIIEIGGEHEDWYDPNFCIFNDVVVHHGDGTFDIFGYPREIFPPTDFHTATLVGEYIYIIGNVGYPRDRKYGKTQVHRLNIKTLAIEEIQTSGNNPGWISDHKATLRNDREIHIRGGKICLTNDGKEDYIDNPSEYVLNLHTFVWNKIVDVA